MARRPRRVHVGGVDEVAAGGEERIEHRMRGGFVGRPAEHVAAEGERRDLQAGATEGAQWHGSSCRGSWVDAVCRKRGGCYRVVTTSARAPARARSPDGPGGRR